MSRLVQASDDSAWNGLAYIPLVQIIVNIILPLMANSFTENLYLNTSVHNLFSFWKQKLFGML